MTGVYCNVRRRRICRCDRDGYSARCNDGGEMTMMLLRERLWSELCGIIRKRREIGAEGANTIKIAGDGVFCFLSYGILRRERKSMFLDLYARPSEMI